VYTKEPETSWWRRFKADALGILPIHSMLVRLPGDADVGHRRARHERSPHEKESRMQHVTSSRRSVGVLAAILMCGVVASASAQTQGMDRRDDRRDDRDQGRAAKQDCKAGDEKSRAECRQEKRTTKHGEAEAQPKRHPRQSRRNDGPSAERRVRAMIRR
jgi:hypothetical protein